MRILKILFAFSILITLILLSFGCAQIEQQTPKNTSVVETEKEITNTEIVIETTTETVKNPFDEEVKLTDSPAENHSPSWSPDGSMITFESYRDGNWEIYSMNADGSGQVNLTENPAAQDWGSSWSPDGNIIAFQSGNENSAEIYIMNSDGSNQTNLTENPANDSELIWSPDGKMIAFESDRDGNWEIYVMNIIGQE